MICLTLFFGRPSIMQNTLTHSVNIKSRAAKEIRSHILPHIEVLDEMRDANPAFRGSAAIEILFANNAPGGERASVRMLKLEEAIYSVRECLTSEFGYDAQIASVVNDTIRRACEQTGAQEWIELADMSRDERQATYDQATTDVFQVNGYR